MKYISFISFTSLGHSLNIVQRTCKTTCKQHLAVFIYLFAKSILRKSKEYFAEQSILKANVYFSTITEVFTTSVSVSMQ